MNKNEQTFCLSPCYCQSHTRFSNAAPRRCRPTRTQKRQSKHDTKLQKKFVGTAEDLEELFILVYISAASGSWSGSVNSLSMAKNHCCRQMWGFVSMLPPGFPIHHPFGLSLIAMFSRWHTKD